MRTTLTLALAGAISMLLAAFGAASAAAAFGDGFGFQSFSGAVTDSSGDSETQAGAHPYAVTTEFSLNLNTTQEPGTPLTDGMLKDVHVDLPPGMIGDPSVTPVECDMSDLIGLFQGRVCPLGAQVGLAEVTIRNSLGLFPWSAPIYKMKAPPGVPARFGMIVFTAPVFLDASIRTGDDYGVTMSSVNTSQGMSLVAVKTTFWGVPADPSHDHQRGEAAGPMGCGWMLGMSVGSCSTDVPRRPFLTNPTSCTADPESWKIRGDSWTRPGELATASFDTDTNRNPMVVDGCESVPFDASMTVRPTNGTAGAPTGLDVELSVPQRDDPDGIATSHLKRAGIVLPEGMAVSPSSAGGLQACAPGQIGLDSDGPATCPDASKLGTVEIDTPLLDEPMAGSVYLAAQGDNPFGSLLAMYVVAEGPGVVVKLAGRIDPDPRTGRLTATFDDNPQLPFETLSLHLKGGPRAPLVNSAECGVKTVTATLAPWSGNAPVVDTDSFEIDEGCGRAGAFDPGFQAGTANPVAGDSSPFRARITRGGGKELGLIDVTLPQGVLADLSHVELCTDEQIAAAVGRGGRFAQGTPACPLGSQIGTSTVGAGAGALPYYPTLPGSDVSGRVFLTEAHTASQRTLAGAGEPQYGLAIEVPAVAGPFDLGTVLVRAAVFVDPDTAELSVLSDRLPRILEGIPLDLRDVRIDIDRDQFTVNPTSCAAQRVDGVIHAQDGTTAERSSRFQVGECSRLGLSPRVGMRLVGRKQTTTGGNPALRVRLRQPAGQANMKTVRAALPKSLALDGSNASGDWLCEFEAGQAADCPASSRVGRAVAVSPLLKERLAGPVYFVKGVRVDPDTGNRIRTLPTLLIKLAGEIDIHVRATSAVRNGKLVSTFRGLPDAAISRFDLNIRGGAKRGILAVTGQDTNICQGRHVTRLATRGQNGKLQRQNVRINTPCGKKRGAAGRRAASRRGR